MAPPPPIVIDAQAVSGITGSISIACWIIVFAPQIYENFKRKSSEGLSLSFIILWLAGDIFNVLGSVLQGVLPTMIILAIYYTLADIVLLWQCLVYGNGDNKTDLIHLSPANPISEDVLETVLSRDKHHHQQQQPSHHYQIQQSSESSYSPSEVEENGDINSTSNNSTTNSNINGDLEQGSLSLSSASGSSGSSTSSLSIIQSILIKILMVALVILAGIIGWYISYARDSGNHHSKPKHPQDLIFDPLAQFFGWLCAILYLGSRIPQIILNFERKSCEGISFMFFLFACLGNLTYVVSILAIDMSWHYLWVNSSWLAGSLGTFALDFTIFVQFFLYNENGGGNYSDLEESEESSLLSEQQQRQQQTYGTSSSS